MPVPYNSNIRDGFGRSSLLWAASFGHRGTLTYLLSRIPATSTDQDTHGSIAVGVAASKGHLRMLEHLIKYRFEIDKPDTMGRSPFWYASRGSHRDVMKLLEEQGANVDRPDNAGMTPLFMAAHNGCTDIVEYLLSLNHHDPYLVTEYYARVRLLTLNKYQSPLVLAAAAGHRSCVELLAKQGRRALGDENVLLAVAEWRNEMDILRSWRLWHGSHTTSEVTNVLQRSIIHQLMVPTTCGNLDLVLRFIELLADAYKLRSYTLLQSSCSATARTPRGVDPNLLSIS